MKRVLIAAVAGSSLIVSGGAQVSRAHTVSRAAVYRTRATIVMARSSLLMVRLSTGDLRTITPAAASTMVTRDGSHVETTSVRTADTVALRSGGALRDLSLGRTVVSGVVSTGANLPGQFIAVSVARRNDVAVELTAATAYSDATGETATISQLADGDLVRVTGVIDRRLGEVTQATSITRVGPLRERHTGR